MGQLVAETIRLYGQRFWLVLPLGLSIALLLQLAVGHGERSWPVIVWAVSPLLTLSYVGACLIVGETRPPARAVVTALVLGTIVFAPVPLLAWLFVLPALAWLGWFGFAVPAALLEGRGPRESLRRSADLARAGLIHSVGSLATLVLVYAFTRAMLLFLLRSQSDQTERVAGFLGDLVISPILFLGAAVLYVDLKARAACEPDAPPPR